MVMKSSKKTKGRVTEHKGASAHEQELTLFLLLTWLIQIRELWLARRQYFFVRVHLVIKLEGVVRVSEVLLCLFFDPLVGCNPVKHLRSIFLLFGVRLLVGFESFVMTHFFLKCCTGNISRKEACEIIAANEGGSIE